MDKKGQALVEFILILPVLLLIIIAMIDVGNIFLEKYNLNQNLDTVSELYQNKENVKLAAYIASENITLDEKKENDITTLIVKKKINITAPVLSNILGKNYEIKMQKVIYNEDVYNEQ